MTKGLPALHFHFLGLLAWSIWNRSLKAQFNIHHFLGIALCVSGLAFYYHLFSLNADIQTWWLNHFVESGDKIAPLSLKSIINQLTETPLALLKLLLPWSITFLLLYQKKLRQSIFSNNVVQFSVIYFIANILVYWIFIDVRDRYLFPFVPFLSVVAAAIIIKKDWWSQKPKTIIAIIILMALIRIGYSAFVMPKLASGEWSNRYQYEKLTDSLLTFSKGQPINLLTPGEKFAIPLIDSAVDTIVRQPVVPYQIAYYLGRKTGHAPKVVDAPVSGQYYLIYENQDIYRNRAEIKFDFIESWYREPMTLIRWK